MTLLSIKRPNDNFEENAEKLIKEGKGKSEAYEDRHYFFIPKETRSPELHIRLMNITPFP
jgi:hypothetical protein